MEPIQFNPPDITEEEISEVCQALRSGWITTGPRTKEFERRLATYCGTEKVACLNSATAALEMNLRVLGIGEGDEVIVPAYTYTASASVVVHIGAKIVFVDCKPGTFEMDYDLMEAAITDKTKAIIPVDLAGIICDYDRIFAAVENKRYLFTADNKLQRALGRVAVVADCAHALGAKRNGGNAGQIADFTSFSFHAVKNLTTAEGGAATWRSIEGIDDDELYNLYMLYSLHGQSKDALAKTQAGAWEYDIVGPWYKCNMTDVAAAIGLGQLKRYPSLLERRKEIIRKYDAACDAAGIMHLEHYGEKYSGSGHLYMTRIPGISEETRNAIIVEMAEKGIACNVHYKPLPMMTAYRKLGFDIENFPNAFEFFKNEITLPLHSKLSDEDVENVISSFTDIVKKYI